MSFFGCQTSNEFSLFKVLEAALDFNSCTKKYTQDIKDRLGASGAVVGIYNREESRRVLAAPIGDATVLSSIASAETPLRKEIREAVSSNELFLKDVSQMEPDTSTIKLIESGGGTVGAYPVLNGNGFLEGFVSVRWTKEDTVPPAYSIRDILQEDSDSISKCLVQVEQIYY